MSTNLYENGKSEKRARIYKIFFRVSRILRPCRSERRRSIYSSASDKLLRVELIADAFAVRSFHSRRVSPGRSSAWQDRKGCRNFLIAYKNNNSKTRRRHAHSDVLLANLLYSRFPSVCVHYGPLPTDGRTLRITATDRTAAD